ncbi:MAG: phosphatidate cytidylyltransferase [Parachlamydia sp.]|jgi:phosphatidate cytidylyltransferase|nr:phosphatidate cytidylyltransferase [Parachlamydia sp.]
MSSQLKQRLIGSVCGIVILVVAIYFSFVPLFFPFFVLLNAAVICMALLEYYDLAVKKGFKPLAFLALGTTTAYVISVSLSIRHSHLEMLPWFILLMSLLLFFLAFFNRQKDPVGNLAITLFGIVYITLPLTCGLMINYFFPSDAPVDGRYWLAYVLTVTKIADVGAYFCGKTLGKNKLLPHISPKKTVEGAMGGLTASLLASLLFYFLIWSPDFLSIWQSLWLGIVLSVLAQLGDLAESILKRDAGIKDSNRLPGFGGLLDMTDSLVFTLPFMYLLLKTWS